MIGTTIHANQPLPAARVPHGAPAPHDHAQAQQRSPQQLRPDAPIAKTRSDTELTDEQKQQVRELKARDAEVRAHEQAHSRAGGQYASAPSYQYTRGPDGQQYAVAGEVTIDASEIPGNPKATITKMEIVIRAALAPAEPSAQDSKVAAQARSTKTKAQAEANRQDDSTTQDDFVSLQERYADYRDQPARSAAAAYDFLETVLQPQVATAVDIIA